MDVRHIKQWYSLVFGLLVVVLPFLGLPEKWKTIALVICGLLISLFSLALARSHEVDSH